MSYGQTIISWHAPEYMKYHKGFYWYLVASTIFLTIIIYGVLSKDVVLSLVFLVLAGVYFLLSRDHPVIIEHELTTLGVKAKRKFYPYSDIESFYIVYEPPHVTTLNIRIKKSIVNEIVIQLGNSPVDDVREVLFNRGIRELEGQKESISSIFSRILRL